MNIANKSYGGEISKIYLHLSRRYFPDVDEEIIRRGEDVQSACASFV